MSLGARATKGGAKGGKDRGQDKKDKPQPKEKVKPQATTEQIRMANMIDRKTTDDGADVRKMVQDLMEMTCRTEEEVCSALHDTDNDMVAACNILLETEKTGEWQTSEKKKKKPPQPVNDGEAPPPRDRDRGAPPRPRRGGRGEARGERERGRGGARGGRGGGRGGRGGRGRAQPRRADDQHEWTHGAYSHVNQMGDAFPATEDWDNEEWSGSLSDTKVFTPSAAAVPALEGDTAMLPPTEEWDTPPTTAADAHIPTYTYHNATQHHANMEQLNSGSRASPATPSAEPAPPDHYLHPALQGGLHRLPQHPVQPMGMSGSLTAAQSQYLSQLTQQSQRHDASVYTANYGVYGSTDLASQRKPQRARVPPPSKIPSSAVEMPGGGEACAMFLDVQFGALEPHALREPPAPHQTTNHVSASPPAPEPVSEPPAPAPAPAPVPAAPAPAPAPVPAPAPAPTQPQPQPVYSTHQPTQQLNESLSSAEAAASQPAVAPEPAVTTNATLALEKQLSASMKQLSVSAADSAPQPSHSHSHQSYVPHRPKQQTVTQQQQQQQNVYAHHPVTHHPPAVYGAGVYAPQVNSTNASLASAAAAVAGGIGGVAAGYPSITQYQPVLNSYQTSSSAGVYNNSALYTANAQPYSYQPQPHHKHKDQYDTNSAASSNSLTSTSTTQTSAAKVAATTAGHTPSTAGGTSAAGAAAGAGAYAGGALYGSQTYAAYDDQMMRTTMPHHMGGYYEVGYGVSGAREGAFGLGAGERFGRTDAASPQQVPAGALPPGYAYFYQPPPPTTYQYGVYPTYGGGSSVGGVGGVGAGGKVGSYQQQGQYSAQEEYKQGGVYSGTGSKSGGAAADLNSAMYAKTHVTLNKVNSYEKAAFHSGTPPPFGAPSHLYVPAPPPPHHHHVPQHQMDVRMNGSPNRRETGSAGGRASTNKAAHSKPNYSHSYWPTN